MNKKSKNTRKKYLKTRVKSALKRRSHIKAYRPTLPVAQSWFRTLNRGLFNGRLKEPEIKIHSLHHDWGRCVADWDGRKTRAGRWNQKFLPFHLPMVFHIELHRTFPTWKDFIETLAHEMVHLYQMTVMEDKYSNHNSNFYSFRKKFKALGLSLYQ